MDRRKLAKRLTCIAKEVAAQGSIRISDVSPVTLTDTGTQFEITFGGEDGTKVLLVEVDHVTGQIDAYDPQSRQFEMTGHNVASKVLDAFDDFVAVSGAEMDKVDDGIAKWIESNGTEMVADFQNWAEPK